MIDGLLALGFREVEGVGKYRVFATDAERRMFVGRSGGLRNGRTISASKSLTDSKFRRALIRLGQDKWNDGSLAVAQEAFGKLLADPSV